MVAKTVCERLRVPLRTVHFTDDYWNLVVKQSVEEIQRGKAPNPDILCNSRVKFGAFREWLDANEEEVGKFDRIASGHYAALERREDDETDVKLVTSGDAEERSNLFSRAFEQLATPKSNVSHRGITQTSHPRDCGKLIARECRS